MSSDKSHITIETEKKALPEGWRMKPLRELVLRFLNGGTPDTSKAEYWDGPIPWITGADAESRITTTARDYITQKGLEESSTNIVPKGNILLVTRTGVGKVSVAGVDVAISQDLTGLIPNIDTIDFNYLYRQLSFLAPYIKRYAQGTIIQGIERKDVERVLIPFPEKPEQRRIAFILDTIDEAIAKTEAVIAKLKQVRAGLLHGLLTRGLDENGELRDPVFHPEQFKDSPVGRIPKEWEVGSLRNLATDGLSNGFFKKPSLVGSGYRLVNVFDLYQPFGIDLDLVERVRATESELKRFEVKTGDIFFTRSSLVLSGIAHCNIIRCLKEPALFESHVMKMIPNQDKVVPEFLAHWCRSAFARTFFMSRARQVTMATISQPDILPLLVALPDKQEQTKIIDLLDGSDDSIRAEKSNCDKLKLIKSGLMSDLLTGRVRVPEGITEQINTLRESTEAH